MKDTMKVIQQIIIFFLMVFISVQLQAHSDCWGTECEKLHVMAPSGLSLRLEPSLNAKILLAIPFGKTVQNHGIASSEVMIGGIKNTWRKVTYKGQTGYSFGAYLSSVRQVPSTDVNKEVRLDFGGNCYGDINYDPSLNWYGIYWDHSALSGSMRSINPQVWTSENSTSEDLELIDYNLVDTSIKSSPSFMFGSKNKLSPQTSLKDFSPKTWNNLAMSDTILELGNILLTAEPAASFKPEYRTNTWSMYDSDSPVLELEISLGSQKQTLSFDFSNNKRNIKAGKTAVYRIKPIELQFAGDLDGDGTTDLLFRIGGEGSGENILYLSSYAGKGEILKKLATRKDGYCC